MLKPSSNRQMAKVAFMTKLDEVTEGPWMMKHNGVHYLMYSGSGANGPDYAIAQILYLVPRRDCLHKRQMTEDALHRTLTYLQGFDLVVGPGLRPL
jgi:hypothetical protein